jgi:Protein of unknown function (DUF3606)
MQPSAAFGSFGQAQAQGGNDMADDLKNPGPRDKARISLAEDYEVRYWTQELGVSAEELKRLVAQHGNSADKIRQALGKK